MANVITYQDLFPSSTIMRQAPGNGLITVPGAGDARLVAPNGMNCQFWIGDAVGKGPILYESLGSMWQLAQPGQPLFLETKLSVFTGTTNSRMAGLSIFTGLPGLGAFYSYQMGWYKLDGKLHVWYDYPTTEIEALTAVTVVDPATTPHLYRIYWNPYNRPLYLTELSLWLTPNYLCFAYSVDSGVTWTSIGTRARDFDFNKAYAGIYCRKWEVTAVNAQADFAYFQANQYNPADQLYVTQIGRGNQDTASLEDQGGLLNEGNKPRFDLPEISTALVLPQVGLALEEGLFVQLDNTDYIKGKLDSDSKELVGGTAIRHIFAYDAASDPWHTHGAGHYGAGRDGKLYYDGVECGPGDFGTLVGGRRKTAWSCPGDFVDTGYTVAPTITADGEMQCALTAQANSGVSSRMRWFLTGDFDIQVDYEILVNGSGPVDGGATLFAYADLNNGFYVRRRMWGSGSPSYTKGVGNNGSWGSTASVATAHTSGKIRLTKTGSTVASFYWDGAAWVQIGTNATMTHNKPMFIEVYSGYTAVTSTVKFRNFAINSGATTNLIGWAREAAGTYRGSKADFPEHALVISSGNGFDIVDTDTDKLWMSFRGATNNLVNGDANWCVQQAVMRDGVLFVSYRTFDTYGTADGWAAWIDFTLDFIRLVRGPTYADAGLVYNVEVSTGMWPRDSANGAISWRNSARAFMAAYYVNWRAQNSRLNWCDLLHDGGSQYRLVANNGGVYLAQWTRWRFEGTANAHLNTPFAGLSTQTVVMRWAQFRPLSRDILYHDRTKLWIVDYATWSTVMGGGGGTWLEDHEYTLSGTVDPYDRALLAQDSMALDDAGNKLYYARNEGVYVMDLTTGVSTLFYGKVGSGATNEVLGTYASISSVVITTDGATPLLLVGMARPDRIWAVNRTTHAIYWKGFQDDAHQPFSMSVGA